MKRPQSRRELLKLVGAVGTGSLLIPMVAPPQASLSCIDYFEAERRCPQKMPIGRLMPEAAIELV